MFFLGLFDEIESSKEQRFTVHCLNVILPPPQKKLNKIKLLNSSVYINLKF